MSEWIDVNERLPEIDSVPVLAFDGENQFVASRWKMGQNEYFKSTICDCCNSEIGEITHWMPLPEPPQG